MPAIPPGCRRVIDIGCGMGQTLIASNPVNARACGVDPDFRAVQLGKRMRPGLQLICGTAELLPVRTGWAQFAIARLSLPYTDIPLAVREAYRILEPGGLLWTVLHPVGMALGRVVEDFARVRARAAAYDLYVLLNGLILHATGRQFRYPLNRARCESFQTGAGMRRVLRAAGYEAINVTTGRFLVVSARKPPATTPLGETG